MKGDRELVFEVVKNNIKALKFASDELKNDWEIKLDAESDYEYGGMNDSEELRNDREVVFEAVKDFGWALEFASEALRNDPEIQQAANNKNDYWN